MQLWDVHREEDEQTIKYEFNIRYGVLAFLIVYMLVVLAIIYVMVYPFFFGPQDLVSTEKVTRAFRLIIIVPFIAAAFIILKIIYGESLSITSKLWREIRESDKSKTIQPQLLTKQITIYKKVKKKPEMKRYYFD